jgi:hypothetical protein
MIDEPDKSELNYERYWSSRPFNELLEKAQEFVGKAYSSTMSTTAFLEWALDHTEPGSEEGADIADAMGKAARMNKMLGELSQDVAKLNQRYGAS